MHKNIDFFNHKYPEQRLLTRELNMPFSRRSLDFYNKYPSLSTMYHEKCACHFFSKKYFFKVEKKRQMIPTKM